MMPYRREESDVPVSNSLPNLRVLPTKKKVNKGVGKLIEYFKGWKYVLRHAQKFDIIHIEWLSLLDYIGIELILIRSLLKKNPKVTYTVHDVTPLHDAGEKTIDRFSELYRIIPAIIVHSCFARNELIKTFNVKPEKVYIHDLAPLLAESDNQEAPSERTRVGIIGTLSPYKGVFDAIRAYALIAGKIRENLLLAGGISHEHKNQVQRLIRELNIDNKVTLIGRYLTIQEVIDLHKTIKVILLPYHRITQSGAALTSLSLGVPVVAYDVGAMAEMIENGKTGYIVPPQNIEALSNAVLNILNNDTVDFHTNCKQYAQSKSWGLIAEQTIQTYESLLTKSNG